MPRHYSDIIPCAGLNYGYYYDTSSVIAYDTDKAPAYTMADYTPSTVPGCRMPHFWLDNHTSLYDCLSDGFTLLSFDQLVQTEALQTAAQQAQVPLKILQSQVPANAQWLTTKLILVRTDQHVAWRGDVLPRDVQGLIDLVRGAASRPRVAHEQSHSHAIPGI